MDKKLYQKKWIEMLIFFGTMGNICLSVGFWAFSNYPFMAISISFMFIFMVLVTLFDDYIIKNKI